MPFKRGKGALNGTEKFRGKEEFATPRRHTNDAGLATYLGDLIVWGRDVISVPRDAWKQVLWGVRTPCV